MQWEQIWEGLPALWRPFIQLLDWNYLSTLKVYSLLLSSLFTNLIRSIGEGNLFTGVCFSVHKGEGASRMHLSLDASPICTPWMHPSLFQWMHLPGCTPTVDAPLPSPEDRISTGGRYAFYWNAYFLSIFYTLNEIWTLVHGLQDFWRALKICRVEKLQNREMLWPPWVAKPFRFD